MIIYNDQEIIDIAEDDEDEQDPVIPPANEAPIEPIETPTPEGEDVENFEDPIGEPYRKLLDEATCKAVEAMTVSINETLTTATETLKKAIDEADEEFANEMAAMFLERVQDAEKGVKDCAELLQEQRTFMDEAMKRAEESHAKMAEKVAAKDETISAAEQVIKDLKEELDKRPKEDETEFERKMRKVSKWASIIEKPVSIAMIATATVCYGLQIRGMIKAKKEAAQ